MAPQVWGQDSNLACPVVSKQCQGLVVLLEGSLFEGNSGKTVNDFASDLLIITLTWGQTLPECCRHLRVARRGPGPASQEGSAHSTARGASRAAPGPPRTPHPPESRRPPGPFPSWERLGTQPRRGWPRGLPTQRPQRIRVRRGPCCPYSEKPFLRIRAQLSRRPSGEESLSPLPRASPRPPPRLPCRPVPPGLGPGGASQAGPPPAHRGRRAGSRGRAGSREPGRRKPEGGSPLPQARVCGRPVALCASEFLGQVPQERLRSSRWN